MSESVTSPGLVSAQGMIASVNRSTHLRSQLPDNPGLAKEPEHDSIHNR